MKTRLILVWVLVMTGIAAQGQTIRNIEIENQQLLPLLTIRPGDQLDPAALSRSIRNLYRTGFFSDIKAYRTKHEDGTVTLRFETLPQIVFGKPEFSGDLGMKEKRIRKFMTEFYPDRMPFTNTRYQAWIRELGNFYDIMGYPQAALDHYVEFSDDGRTAIPMIHVQPGPPVIVGDLVLPTDRKAARLVKLKPGDRLDRKQMDHDIKALIAHYRGQGFFQVQANYDVTISDMRARVTVNVVPGTRYTVRLVNASIPSEDEAELVETLRRDGLDEVTLSIVRNNLFYRLLEMGYDDPEITTDLQSNEIRFVVNRAQRQPVDSLEVQSTEHLAVEKPAYFNRLSRSVLERAINEQLHKSGYLTPDIRFQYVAREKRLFVDVDRGPLRQIGPITVLGEREVLPSLPAIREDAVFSPEAISGAIDAGEQELRRAGYYDPAISVEQGEATGNRIPLQLTVLTEGRRSIASIYIYGNRKIELSSIQRMIGKDEGNPVTRAEIRLMRERLEESGMFESIDITTFPVSEDEVSLFVSLRERPLTTVRYGIGFNSDEGPRGSITINRNYLFHQELNGTLLTRVSQKRQQFYLNVSGRTHFMASSFAFLENKDDYKVSRIGFSVSYSGTPGRYTNMISSLEIRRNHWWDVDIPEEEIDRELHPVNVLALNTQLLLDRRDDLLFPTAGYYLSLRLEPSYDMDMERFYLKYLEKFSLFLNRFSISQTFGHIAAPTEGYSVPLPERFFTGGTNTLRISSFERAGPTFSTGAPSGGRVLALINMEYHVPLMNELEGVLFLDIGNVWRRMEDVSFSSAVKDAGIGIRYRTPLGPIRAELAWNLDQDTFPSRWKLQFSIGNTF